MKLFLLLCLNGLVAVAVYMPRTVNHQYHLIKTLALWPIAQNYCRVMYTDIATVVTDNDFVRWKKESDSKRYTDLALVGLYNDLDSWRWSLNDLPLKNVTYTFWYNGQPDNYNGRESCSIAWVYGLWADAPCTDLRYFICYNASFSGSARFIGITIFLTWHQALNYCRTHHTDLAFSLNSSDSNTLWYIRDRQGDSWIGLYRDSWKWADGTNATNLPWSPGEPGYSSYENFAGIYYGKFYDLPYTYQYFFYCHTILPAREQQIVRLQVKSDGSVLDPAVQSAILEQVKQKMKEKGMLENSTVTWRVQPDGNIFQKKNKDVL